jgi:hypothetical protein
VVTGSGTDGSARLDGFTITGGNANGSLPDNAGGGMFNDTGSPSLDLCTFSGNAADYGGGMYNDASSPLVSFCAFIGNAAGHGGGIYNVWDSDLVVVASRFSGNTAGSWGGGMHSYSSSPTVTGCVFDGNTAQYGGGIEDRDGSVTSLTNCTFGGNSATFGGGGMRIWATTTTAANCIFWGNTALTGPQLAVEEGSTLTIGYSVAEGGEPAVYVDASTVNWDGSNLTDDPQFADADLRLSAGSPCIDAGDNTAVPADAADLDDDGNTAERTPLDVGHHARFFDDLATIDGGVGTPPIVDMGAYEYYLTIASDFDDDGDVDGEDVEMFVQCAGGHSVPLAPECSHVDIDGDGDGDQSDYGILQRCMSGDGNPIDPTCLE